MERAGVDVPTVEVRMKGLSIDTTVYVGSRALPTLINSYRNVIEASPFKRPSLGMEKIFAEKLLITSTRQVFMV